MTQPGSLSITTQVVISSKKLSQINPSQTLLYTELVVKIWEVHCQSKFQFHSKLRDCSTHVYPLFCSYNIKH